MKKKPNVCVVRCFLLPIEIILVSSLTLGIQTPNKKSKLFSMTELLEFFGFVTFLSSYCCLAILYSVVLCTFLKWVKISYFELSVVVKENVNNAKRLRDLSCSPFILSSKNEESRQSFDHFYGCSQPGLV